MHGRNHRPKGWFGETDPGGSDPLNWLNRLLGPARLDQAILASNPAGFWKLDEPSGDTVIDYSGNALDMTCPTTGGMSTPTRLQAPGPPGDPATRFQPYSRARRSWDALSGDFTAEVWVRRNKATAPTFVMGQSITRTAGQSGWNMGIEHDSAGADSDKPYLVVGGTSFDYFAAMNTHPVGEWRHFAVVRSGATWQFYIDGLAQFATPETPGYTATSDVLWFGNDSELFGAGSNPINSDVTLSYGAIFPRALSGGEIYSHVEGGMVTGRTITGDHTVSPAVDTLLFAVGTITVTYPTAVGRVGSSFTLKNKGSGTVTMTSTDDIDGAGSLVLGAGDAATIASDGVEWWITGGHGL
jgi:hypothetical protein